MVLEHGAGVAVAVVPHAAGAGLARPGVAERGRGVEGPDGFHGGRAGRGCRRWRWAGRRCRRWWWRPRARSMDGADEHQFAISVDGRHEADGRGGERVHEDKRGAERGSSGVRTVDGAHSLVEVGVEVSEGPRGAAGSTNLVNKLPSPISMRNARRTLRVCLLYPSALMPLPEKRGDTDVLSGFKVFLNSAGVLSRPASA